MSRNRILAAIVLVLGLLAAIVGSPERASSIDTHQLARAIEAESDHVTAIELARWIRERKPELRIVDLRDEEEFATYRVPGARRMSLTAATEMPLRESETIVLLSGGGAHAAQAWVLLRARGHRRVFFLRGGMQEWLADVMSPVNPSPELAELSRYFGGTPRKEAGAAVTAEEIRRRGC